MVLAHTIPFHFSVVCGPVSFSPSPYLASFWTPIPLLGAPSCSALSEAKTIPCGPPQPMCDASFSRMTAIEGHHKECLWDAGRWPTTPAGRFFNKSSEIEGVHLLPSCLPSTLLFTCTIKLERGYRTRLAPLRAIKVL